MFKSLLHTIFARRAKAWAGAGAGAVVASGFAFLAAHGLTVEPQYQAAVAAAVVGFVVHQVDNAQAYFDKA